MMATTSVGGPPVLLYLLSGNDPPAVNRANIVTYYFLTQFLLIASCWRPASPAGTRWRAPSCCFR